MPCYDPPRPMCTTRDTFEQRHNAQAAALLCWTSKPGACDHWSFVELLKEWRAQHAEWDRVRHLVSGNTWDAHPDMAALEKRAQELGRAMCAAGL